MKVAIVNDTAMAVEILRRIVTSVPDYQLVWVAADGAQAVEKCARERPDVILMDMIMPVMDGVEATRRIMAESPCAILIVTSAPDGNAGKVFEAMGAGALDVVGTPVLGAGGDGEGREILLQKLRTIGRLIGNGRMTPAAPVKPAPARAASLPPLLAIGASTGGPAALAVLLGGLPADFPAAIVIVQHVDEQFTDSFVDWLAGQTVLPVRRARAGDTPRAGQVLVAGGTEHLVLRPHGRLDYSAEPRDYAYQPSVSVFFENLARGWDGVAVGVLLTGMGRDGAQGLLAMRRAGFHTIAQDEASCAVYGMPRAAAQLDAAVEVLPLDAIAQAVCHALQDAQQGRQA